MGKALTSNEITTNMTNWIQEQTKNGLSFPKNFSPNNALKSALLILAETTAKIGNNYVPALEACSSVSIYRALQKMLTYGLNPAKKQCYLIPYAGKLSCDESYFGVLNMAKEMANIAKVNTQIIYEGDEFEIEINQLGEKLIVKHKQSLANMDNEKIVGAYAVVIYNDNTFKTEIMNFEQIKRSWSQSKSGFNKGTHGKFAEEMCKRTVTKRALKTDINSSNDNNLAIEDEPDFKDEVKAEIVENTGKGGEIGFDTFETVEEYNEEIRETIEEIKEEIKEAKEIKEIKEAVVEVTADDIGF